VDAGLIDAAPYGPAPPLSVSVVIPVRDRAAGLAETLAALDCDLDVVVVDDGSLNSDAVRDAARSRPGTRVVRRGRPGGPAAARNAGWRRGRADLVAFVDADCVPAPGWTVALVGHFADPTLAAVAPRIVPRASTPPVLHSSSPHHPVANPAGLGSAVAAWETHHSPLDLGTRRSIVRPGGPRSYVPSAALIVRRVALEQVGGFDEDLRTGEDVDLVWRLVAAGWRVAYDPTVEVSHPVRRSLGGLARQRFGYGKSAAPLAARHGPAVAPVVAEPVTLLAWGLAAVGRPTAGAALGVGASLAATEPLRRRVAEPLDRLETVRLVLGGQLALAAGLVQAARRCWWPTLAVGAVASRRLRRLAGVLAIAPPLLDWLRRRPPAQPWTWCLLAAVDDGAYGAGVWAGAGSARSLRCLLPARSATRRVPAP
jgi:mycofactocin system glycosyltransferase